MSSAETPKFCTVGQYEELEELSSTKSEYVDGWIRAMGGASVRHNIVSVNTLISLGTQLKGKSCRPFSSDTKIRIDRDNMKRFYYPDVQVVCESNDQQAVFQDAPVLIVEVLSPSTRRYDLDEKMSAYLTIPSLQAYIALEQHQPMAVVMRRIDSGFLRETIAGIRSCIELPFLDCVLRLQEIYDGVEFTDQCVQEPEREFEVG